MRFNDMIATVLGQPSDRPDRLTAIWRQLVDLLAQHRPGAAAADTARAYALLRATRGSVDPAVRQQAARSFAGRQVDPDLIAFFTEDSASVAAPLIAAARLEPEVWIDLLPRLGPAARALLRHREDLDQQVRQALAAWGRSDFVLEGVSEPAAAAAPEAQTEHSESQIRELVARIEAYRKQRDGEHSAPESARAEPGQAAGFRWETGTDGILVWIEGAPRGALVGQSIAWIAGPGQCGVDGQAAGGFEKRAPFRDARFSVAGDGPAAGDWRISGIPFFDPVSGGFLGYRGTARRPRPDEIARAAAETPDPSGVFGTHFPADSLRQLIHELRTPLNAIIGFAEMIEGQYMGPAAAPYRGRAATIVEQARGLLGAVDDLDTAARIESRRLELNESAVDAVALLVRLHESYQRLAEQRGSRIHVEIGEGLPLARVEPGAAERMFGRILAGTIGLAAAGEAIRARLFLAPDESPATLCLAVDRPRAIDGLGETALLDPGYSPEGDWPGAPALGLGFALRLVRNLAEAVGGSLRIDPAQFALFLPAVADAALPVEKSGGSA